MSAQAPMQRAKSEDRALELSLGAEEIAATKKNITRVAGWQGVQSHPQLELACAGHMSRGI